MTAMEPSSSSSNPHRSGSHSSHSSHHSGTHSSTSLENRLHVLREKSNALSQTLTQKLATSQSGQHLLHIGPSLSTLPPDLHSLQINLSPLLEDVETFEHQSRAELERIVNLANNIRVAQLRSYQAKDCAAMYHDLLAAESLVKTENNDQQSVWEKKIKEPDNQEPGMDMGGVGGGGIIISSSHHSRKLENDTDSDLFRDKLEHVSSLERAAHITLHLIQELKISTDHASAITINAFSTNNGNNNIPSMSDPLPRDTEKAQFLMKLAPRIRNLESQIIKCLIRRMEEILRDISSETVIPKDGNDTNTNHHDIAKNGVVPESDSLFWMVSHQSEEQQNLIAIGHCLRGLALLGRGKEAETTFARVAIVPIIRSKLSMGKLDEGGSRGQCAGLFSVLDDMACAIAQKFGSVIRLSEEIFDISTLDAAELFPPDNDILKNTEVDLVTAGVWVPIATALMADSTIKMAIFSPGIATILQANYTALDMFLSELASRLLTETTESPPSDSNPQSDILSAIISHPSVTQQTIEASQKRIYRHPITFEFSKKWNLPIYYQLRFGESCTRLNNAIVQVQKSGWQANVFTGDDSTAESIMNTHGFEVPLFIELYDIISGLWKSDVIIRPLANRFLRGALQLVNRTVDFVKEGLEGSIKFGSKAEGANDGTLYSWGDKIGDVATVAWELTVLESCMNHDYLSMVLDTILPKNVDDMPNVLNTQEELDDLRNLVAEVFMDAAQEIGPLIEKSWNEVIVNILTKSCSSPLTAVKGVAATYRMTNRPAPTQASPFVSMILRPLQDFDENFSSRTPPQVGSDWKVHVVSIVSERYSSAVEELLETVKRTEDALKNRKARRFTTGGMSDGEKVKLQLYLDYKEFAQNVSDIGVDVSSIEGLLTLKTLAVEAEALLDSN